MVIKLVPVVQFAQLRNIGEIWGNYLKVFLKELCLSKYSGWTTCLRGRGGTTSSPTYTTPFRSGWLRRVVYRRWDWMAAKSASLRCIHLERRELDIVGGGRYRIESVISPYAHDDAPLFSFPVAHF